MTDLYGVKTEVNEIEKAIVKLCRKENRLHAAQFFDYKKHANQVSIDHWHTNNRPHLLICLWDKKQINKLPFTLSIYLDIGHGYLFVVNNKTLEVLWGKNCINIYSATGALKGVVYDRHYFGTKTEICMQIC